jgi:hypothetical protein
VEAHLDLCQEPYVDARKLNETFITDGASFELSFAGLDDIMVGWRNWSDSLTQT